MYKLYVSIASYTFADASCVESDIINTMCDYFRKDNSYRFIIIKSDGETDELYKFIKNETDLRNYIKDYNDRQLKESTVTQLKREILDMSDKNKVKRKKKTKEGR